MKRKISMVVALLVVGVFLSYGQKDDKKVSVKFSGFVKVDYMFDSRQTVNAREGHFLLFPASEKIINGKDINDQANFNILAVQTRLRAKFSGPDFFGMETSGMVEGAFFGHTNSDINGFRLRHAFIKLSNDAVNIFLGQYWHPMFVTAVYPGTYSFSTGVPFQPFARNPQLRVETKGKVKFIGVMFSERDFASRGPIGTTSKYVRDAGIPQVHAQLQFGDKRKFLGGFGVNMKTLRPVLGKKNMTNMAYIGYFRTKLGKVTWKGEATYGENMSDLLSIGAIGEMANGDFTASKTTSFWTEFSGDISESTEWGLFAGYTENGGFKDAVTGSMYGLGATIANSYRLSPRVGWKSGNMKIGVEGEYTSALYGSLGADYKTIETAGVDNVANVRVSVSAIYNF
ncbi:MAG: hypothetical protein JKY08_08670 [Flavobacteriaceae bacterium]|nr:hypothetical protein [Flavobacteriaceae bacterium]